MDGFLEVNPNLSGCFANLEPETVMKQTFIFEMLVGRMGLFHFDTQMHFVKPMLQILVKAH